MSIGTGETLLLALTAIVEIGFRVVPLVLIVVLWKRNTRLQRRIEALERRLTDGT